MKHSPASLLERAAEIYDFSSGLKLAPAPAERIAAAAPARACAAEAAPRPLREAPAPDRAAVPVDRLSLAERGFLLPDEPVTGLAEEIRLVKRRLLSGIERRADLPEAKRRTILIASAQAGDGKTFCAVNLALSLASERDVEVLLVDGDVSKPEILATLGIEERPGLVDALADPAIDPESLVVRTDIAGLSLLPAGRKTNNVPELLASSRTSQLLSRFVGADPRRIVIFDSPPALVASPASILAAYAGDVLLVVRADRTTESDLRETVGLLSACPNLSLLLNGAGFAATGRRYGRYKGYGDAS